MNSNMEHVFFRFGQDEYKLNSDAAKTYAAKLTALWDAKVDIVTRADDLDPEHCVVLSIANQGSTEPIKELGGVDKPASIYDPYIVDLAYDMLRSLGGPQSDL